MNTRSDFAKAKRNMLMSVPAKNDGREHNQADEDDSSYEGTYDGTTDALAEVVELLADGKPVGVGVPIVGQVHNGRSRCCCRHCECHHHLHACTVLIN